MSGFATIQREAAEHPLFRGDSSRLGAWTWLILGAAWKDTQFDIRGTTVPIRRGQICVSIRQLADAWGWSKSAVDRFLTRLETETMIEREAGHGRCIITICNYGRYQDRGEGGRDTSGTPTGTPAGHQRDTKEQGNQETREPIGSPPLTPRHIRGRDWPAIPDWVPVEPWNGFIEMRRRKNANPTPRAAELLIDKLTKLRKAGCDPGAVLDQSTERNWTGLFQPKDDRDDRSSNHPPRDNRDGLMRAADRALGLDGDWEPARKVG